MPEAPSISVQGANSRVVVGLVGFGKCCETYWGRFLLRSLQYETEDCYVVGIADPSKTLRSLAKDTFADSNVFEDYREMLGDKRIEAIVCSNEEHMHAQVIIDSLRAGKHVYVIPPLCRYLSGPGWQDRSSDLSSRLVHAQ